jgi:hypothetical protein
MSLHCREAKRITSARFLLTTYYKVWFVSTTDQSVSRHHSVEVEGDEGVKEEAEVEEDEDSG